MNAHDHADDGLLSLLIDGATDRDEAEVLAGCARCTGRLAALRGAAAAVAAPVDTPPADRRDSAVAAAVAAAVASPAAEARGGAAPARHGARRQRPRLTQSWLVPAAAVLAVLLGGVALVTRGAEGPDAVTLDAPTDQEALSEADDDMDAQLGAGSGVAVVDGGDLGAIDDGDELRQVVEAHLDSSPRRSATGLRGSGATDEAQGDGSATAAPSPDRQSRIDRCAAAVTENDPDAGRLVFVASAEWQASPALVLGFEATDQRRLTRRVYVVDPADCAVLTVVSFTA